MNISASSKSSLRLSARSVLKGRLGIVLKCGLPLTSVLLVDDVLSPEWPQPSAIKPMPTRVPTSAPGEKL